MADNCQAENRGCGAPTLRAQGCQFAEIRARAKVIRHSAMKAESKWASEKMSALGVRLLFTVGSNDNGTRKVLFPGGFDARSLIRVLDPVFWQFGKLFCRARGPRVVR